MGGIAVCDTTGAQADPAIVSDGSGGAIVVWSDGRDFLSGSPLYAQRVGAAGTTMWTRQGIRVSGANSRQEVPALTTDGSGGAVAVWMDTRFGDYDIMAQRVESNGTISWGLGDRIVAFATGRQTGPQIVPDGAGGYVVVWTDTRNGGDFDIYGQRLSPTGLFTWAQNGVPVCADPNPQMNPQLVPDGTGGAIFVWEDYRGIGGPDIYAQRINGLNVAQWTADGIPVSDAGGSQEAPQVASDGSGGMFLGWHDSRNGSNYDIYVQHINSAGASAWTADGLAVCTAAGNQLNPRVVPDGAGGMVVAWGDARTGLDSDLYVDRVFSDGSLASGGGGLALAVVPYDQQVPKLVPDPSGGAVVAWEDKRANGAYPQVYAQRFLVATTAIAEKPVGPSLGILASAPNPFQSSTEIKFALSRPGAAVLEIFDLSGRRVFTQTLAGLDAGLHRVAFRGRDDAGRLLPSGVYAARLWSEEAISSERIVLRR
jgi:flagellar hook capping protein FlgD